MDAGVLRQGAIAALQRRQWDEAHRHAARLIEAGSRDPDVHFIGAIALLEQERAVEAAGLLHGAIALAPDRAELQLYSGAPARRRSSTMSPSPPPTTPNACCRPTTPWASIRWA